MMGFGTGFPLFVALGFLVLGPKRMHAMLGQLARAKAEFDKASRGIKSQLVAELGGAPPSARKDDDEPAPGFLPDFVQQSKIPPSPAGLKLATALTPRLPQPAPSPSRTLFQSGHFLVGQVDLPHVLKPHTASDRRDCSPPLPKSTSCGFKTEVDHSILELSHQRGKP